MERENLKLQEYIECNNIHKSSNVIFSVMSRKMGYPFSSEAGSLMVFNPNSCNNKLIIDRSNE